MKLVQKIVKPYLSGLHLGSYTYLFSNILDHTVSKQDTLELIKKNPNLYIKGTVSNFVNLIGLSPIYYIFADNFLIHDKSLEINFIKLLWLVLTHNVLFYKLHKTFHENKSLYFIHKFHHRFVSPIPSNGNAVSIKEYNIAYVLPFLIGALLFKPNAITFQLAIGVISFFNSLVHCGPLRNIKLWPIFVVPKDHLVHHEKLDTKYASPTINIDYISNKTKNFFEMQNKYKQYKYTNGL